MRLYRRRCLKCPSKEVGVAILVILLVYMTMSTLNFNYREYASVDDSINTDDYLPRHQRGRPDMDLHVYNDDFQDSIQRVATPRREIVDTHGCSEWFNYTMEDNLKVISQYPQGQAKLYFHKMDYNRSYPKQIVTSFPVLVTAANSGFYGTSQGLLKSIVELLVPKYPGLKIVYYDMGLSPNQHQQLKTFCSICDVRKFPFENYPVHVKRLKTYTWKPIILRTLLMEFGWVWWMDSSVRFKTSDLDRALDYSKKHSVLFFTYAVAFAVAQHTDIQTMDYLGEDRCKFRHFGEIEATFVLFHFDDVTKILVDAWAACALNEACMCPPGTAGKLSCRVTNPADGRCHRFDQAVLSILLRRLYHDKNDYPSVDEPFHIHDIKRGNSVSFF